MQIQAIRMSAVVPSQVKASHAASRAERPATPELADQPETGADEARGVIRLLEEGHFKGVADVRLRINFFDELSAKANALAGSAAEAGGGGLVGEVNDQLDTLATGAGLEADALGAVETAGAEFEAAVNEAVAQSTSAGGKLEPAGLTDSVEQAFDMLVGQLRELLMPAPEPPAPEAPFEELPTPEGGETPAVAEIAASAEEEPAPETPPPFDAEAFLAELSDTFQAALQSWRDSMESAATLPDPTPPTNGSGNAYDKFLAIYNQLRGVTPEVNEVA